MFTSHLKLGAFAGAIGSLKKFVPFIVSSKLVKFFTSKTLGLTSSTFGILRSLKLTNSEVDYGFSIFPVCESETMTFWAGRAGSVNIRCDYFFTPYRAGTVARRV